MTSSRIYTAFFAVIACLAWGAPTVCAAKEYHVSVHGNGANAGSSSKPLKTISAAALRAQPGDTIIVHQGVYRERVTPPRGGESDSKRITYQAAPGEHVEIKGSEPVSGWEKVEHDTWKAIVPNSFFGGYNPFGDPIHGDWFNPKGRVHHTGAVYLDGEWLIEAAKLDEVMAPAGTIPSWLTRAGHDYLLNVAWLQPLGEPKKGARIPATGFTEKNGTQNAACSEGGECIGFIRHGHWVKYERVDFGEKTDQLLIRAASASQGGLIEIHLDGPGGELLGSCRVHNTGGWQSWGTLKATIKPVSGVKTLCLVFKDSAAVSAQAPASLWYAEVGPTETTIWAQFPSIDPNEHLVEVNVRPAVFYPDKPFINCITVRGFALRHAATQWAPPTAEQVGLIGTHWSKGWIIEDNTISHSICTGVTLGKHGDEFDNTSADTAEGYVKTIERALAMHWNKETIGGHIVRNNTISHCEQAGLVGSMGAAFSTISGNTIHDIHVRRLFTGAEMAGIKIHGAVDTTISRNHIFRANRGIWLDWMAQGTRVSRNLLHDNGPSEDLFVEVNHGPLLVDNNILLSYKGILINSQGAAYMHNLIAGRQHVLVGENRLTPHLKEHGTGVLGLAPNPSGDERYYNNLFINGGTAPCDRTVLPMFMAGNVYLKGAKPSKHEQDPLVLNTDPALQLVEETDGLYLRITLDKARAQENSPLVTTELLGKAKAPDLPYVQRDGTPYRIDTDYFGKKRSGENPMPGPFETETSGKLTLKVWPNSP